MTSDDRFTWGLIIGVLDVLERHGYHRYDNQHTGQAFGMIFDLAYVYDGTRDATYGTHLDHASPGPRTEPGPSDPDADRHGHSHRRQRQHCRRRARHSRRLQVRPRRRLH